MVVLLRRALSQVGGRIIDDVLVGLSKILLSILIMNVMGDVVFYIGTDKMKC